MYKNRKTRKDGALNIQPELDVVNSISPKQWPKSNELL